MLPCAAPVGTASVDLAEISAWPEVRNAFNYFQGRRDLISIQNWLASEGYKVGNLMTDEMLNLLSIHWNVH